MAIVLVNGFKNLPVPKPVLPVVFHAHGSAAAGPPAVLNAEPQPAAPFQVSVPSAQRATPFPARPNDGSAHGHGQPAAVKKSSQIKFHVIQTCNLSTVLNNK